MDVSTEAMEMHAPARRAPESQPRPAEAAFPAEQPRKRSRAWLFVGALAVLVVGGALAFWLFSRGKEGTDDAQIEADVVPVSARVPGQVSSVKVRDDQPVKRGQVLLQLDDADQRARVAAAQAELETARAQEAAADAQVAVATAGARGGFSSAQAALSGSAASVASAEAQLKAAQAALVKSQASANKAHLDLGRAQKLVAANVMPQAGLDSAQASSDEADAALLQAQAQVAAAEQVRALAKSRVSEARGSLARSAPVKPQIAAAEAQARLAAARVQSAQAALQLAELQLQYTQVVAPADGTISRLTARVGQLLQSGQPVAELVPDASYVIANFKETQIGQMRVGQHAEVEIDAYPGRKFDAQVQSLSGGTGARFALLPPDNATGNFVKVVQRVPVRLEWTRPPGVSMRAGLSADVTVFVR
jgi:membrane fusion protein (multidrug efflux system)